MASKRARIVPERLMAVDAWFWTQASRIMLQSGPFAHEAHEYLAGPLRDTHPHQVAKKGSQMGWTEKSVLKTLHGMIHKRYRQGVLHLFPTADDVSDFSKARFNTLIDENPETIGAFVQSTDAANIKRINSAMLYLRGARATQRIQGLASSSSKLKSIPVDRIVEDEYDEMDPSMVALATERVAHSKIKEIEKLSTPTIPDYGVDADYKKSDQMAWAILCRSCNTRTILELEFPKCLSRRRDGSAFRSCVRCGAEIFPRDGEWIAQAPSVKDLRGYWISQLNSLYVDPTVILNEYERISELTPGERQVFYNSKLAMAYVDAANRIKPSDLWACTSADPMDTRHPGPAAMGVDVGAWLHVVIGYKPAPGVVKVCYAGRHKDWHELRDLGIRFNVDCCVIDMEPELHKAREFQRGQAFPVFLCDYQVHQRGDARWNLDDRSVVINRTEILDRVHTAATTAGRFILPRRSQELEQYVLEMCNLVKVLVENKDGSKNYEYKQVGPDHYRHATAYLLLALERVSVYQPAFMFGGESRAPAFAQTDYNPFGYEAPRGHGGQAIVDYNPFGR